jgi:D-glycero-D-manno-heptose 1,7-bisphosphate phosphatase
MKVVIMAGGKGTRIASVASEIPKPMIPVCGKPILERQIDCLREQGLTDIVIVTGHLGSAIQNYFGDGSTFGVKISYYHEDQPLGTAGALLSLKSVLTEDFFLINGDIIFDVDFSRMLAFHKERGAAVTLAAHPNSHPYDSALIVADGDGKVTDWLHKEDKRTIYKNRVNAGIHLLASSVLKSLGGSENLTWTGRC